MGGGCRYSQQEGASPPADDYHYDPLDAHGHTVAASVSENGTNLSGIGLNAASMISTGFAPADYLHTDQVGTFIVRRPDAAAAEGQHRGVSLKVGNAPYLLLEYRNADAADSDFAWMTGAGYGTQGVLVRYGNAMYDMGGGHLADPVAMNPALGQGERGKDRFLTPSLGGLYVPGDFTVTVNSMESDYAVVTVGRAEQPTPTASPSPDPTPGPTLTPGPTPTVIDPTPTTPTTTPSPSPSPGPTRDVSPEEKVIKRESPLPRANELPPQSKSVENRPALRPSVVSVPQTKQASTPKQLPAQ